MTFVKRLGWWSLDYLYAGWRQLASILRPGIPASYGEGDPNLPAVVLLPGVYERWLFLEPAAARLNARGFRVFSVPELGLNRRPVPPSAALVTELLARLGESHGVAACILLAHSKGGLIGKQIMLDAAGLAEDAVAPGTDVPEAPAVKHDAGTQPPAPPTQVEVLGMVAVATPFSGSPYARYLPSRTMRGFSPADAALLSLLNRPTLNHKIVSIYPEFDPHIPGGSALEGAVNIEVPVSGHFRTLADQRVLAAVEHSVAALAAGTPA